MLLLLHLGSHCHILLLLHLLLLQLLLVVFLLVLHHLSLSILVVRLLAWVHAILAHALSFIFTVHLWHYTKCLLALELEVCVLGLLNLTVDTVDLKLVGLDLRLVVLKFGHHLLELLASLFKVLLVDNKFLGDFCATLLGQDVLKLNVELFLLLDEDVFFGDFFCLCNQPLLE